MSGYRSSRLTSFHSQVFPAALPRRTVTISQPVSTPGIIGCNRDSEDEQCLHDVLHEHARSIVRVTKRMPEATRVTTTKVVRFGQRLPSRLLCMASMIHTGPADGTYDQGCGQVRQANHQAAETQFHLGASRQFDADAIQLSN